MNWTPFGKNWDAFVTDGLNEPGTLLHVQTKDGIEEVLIGDCNAQGGVCDCCRAFSNSTIIEYAVVWKSEFEQNDRGARLLTQS